jgi:hypothetical protein
MRDSLVPFEGQRLTVRATVFKLGTCQGWARIRERTICLGNITAQDGAVLTDHVWLTLGKRLAALAPHRGDLLELTGRVSLYRRGLKREPNAPVTFDIDYGLTYPSRCRVIARAAPLPEDVPLAGELVRVRQDLLLIRTIDALWASYDEPPSLKHLYGVVTMSPMGFLSQLHKAARAGRIAFRADGRVYTVAQSTTEGVPQ